MTTAPTFSAD